MTESTTTLGNAGLDALTQLPLLTSIWRRRTHRVSRGSSVEAGSMSWKSSESRTPLTELEEAVLIYLTYSNLLNVVQSWIEQGRVSFVVGLVGLHILVSIMVAIIFWLRIRNRPLFRLSMFTRSKGA